MFSFKLCVAFLIVFTLSFILSNVFICISKRKKPVRKHVYEEVSVFNDMIMTIWRSSFLFLALLLLSSSSYSLQRFAEFYNTFYIWEMHIGDHVALPCGGGNCYVNNCLNNLRYESALCLCMQSLPYSHLGTPEHNMKVFS